MSRADGVVVVDGQVFTSADFCGGENGGGDCPFCALAGAITIPEASCPALDIAACGARRVTIPRGMVAPSPSFLYPEARGPPLMQV